MNKLIIYQQTILLKCAIIICLFQLVISIGFVVKSVLATSLVTIAFKGLNYTIVSNILPPLSWCLVNFSG